MHFNIKKHKRSVEWIFFILSQIQTQNAHISRISIIIRIMLLWKTDNKGRVLCDNVLLYCSATTHLYYIIISNLLINFMQGQLKAVAFNKSTRGPRFSKASFCLKQDKGRRTYRKLRNKDLQNEPNNILKNHIVSIKQHARRSCETRT